MKRLLVLLCSVALVATSCQKEDNVDPVDNGVTTDSLNYLPTKKGTYLKLQISGSLGLARASTLTATGTQEKVDGINYEIWKETESGQTMDFAKLNHKYYTYLQAVDPKSGTQVKLAFIYLNDTASVGSKWTSNGNVGGYPVAINVTTVDRNITKVVGGKTFQNVMHTRVDLIYTLPVFGDLKLVAYDYYVANNVGIIKVDATSYDLLGDIQGSQSSDITEYAIK